MIPSWSLSHHLRQSVRFIYTVLLIAFFCGSIGAATFPVRPNGSIADYANVLDNTAKQKITEIAQALDEQAGFALVVATIPDLGDEVIDDYAPALYKAWGIGKKGVDEGVLILLSLNPRKVRIEVGLGSEGYLTDAMTGRIIDTYGVPYFRTGDYGGGFSAIAGVVAQAVAREKNITLNAVVNTPAPGAVANVKVSPFMIIVLILVFILMISTRFGRALLWGLILASLMGGGSSGRGGGGGFGGGFGGGGFGGGMSGGGGSSRGF